MQQAYDAAVPNRPANYYDRDTGETYFLVADETGKLRGRTAAELGRPLTPEEEFVARKNRGMFGIRQPDGTLKHDR